MPKKDAMTYQRNEAPEPLAADASMWCENCRKDDHRTEECWSTSARIGAHDAAPIDLRFPTSFAWPPEISNLASDDANRRDSNPRE